MAKLYGSAERGRFFRLLVDSGADYTLISSSDALILGIEYKKISTREVKVEVANLAFIHTKKTRLVIEIEGVKLSIPVLVAKEEVECLLGRKGVFTYFDILFQEQRQQMIFIRET
ncbi:MAG: retroviral-like aspartic protease family protein [Candidatus Peregrinibacteria bacterium]|nr:retroviral-like aspartic protease family protein [Candidatus Peregrinibacteria bacterium]